MLQEHRKSHLGWRSQSGGVQTHIIWGLAALGARATEWSCTVSATWTTPASPFSHSPTRALYLTTLPWEELSPRPPSLESPSQASSQPAPGLTQRDWNLEDTTIPSTP